MRLKKDHDGERALWRWFSDDHGEVAYATTRLRGPELTVEFPSDWHEQRRGWFRLGLGFLTVAVSFPWSKTVPDEGQCSGPTYGFKFFEDILWIYYGKDTGRRGDPRITIYMPWHWKHQRHRVLTEPESHSYRYTLRNGTVQERTATIRVEDGRWTRNWLPRAKESRWIDVQFSDEVGERTGSWKGGTIGCSYTMLPGETPLDTLRRMERERKF